jgi:hypothetical protein
MDAIHAAIIANVERMNVEWRCRETCGFECHGWCKPPVLFTQAEPKPDIPQLAIIEDTTDHPVPGAEPSTPVVTSVERPRVSIVLFTPEALYTPNTPFNFFSGAPRKVVSGPWDDLARFLSVSREGNPTRYPDHDIAKRARGAWVPGTYRGTAGHGNLARDLIETNLLVIDIDHGDPRAVADALGAYDTIIHTTYKHTPSHPRCRGVFRLTGSCRSAADYNTGEKFIARILSAMGFTVPAKDSTLGKLAYLPMHQPGVEPAVIVNTGKPLDLDKIVAAERQREQIERKKKTPTSTTRPSTKSPVYVAAAVRRAIEAVASASFGDRHNTLYKEAASLARVELALPEHEILDALRPAAHRADPEESDDEHERVIKDAIRKARSA